MKRSPTKSPPIGPYVVDFCCLEPKLIIEVDGGQHARQVQADERRTLFLQQSGYRVVRFWNDEVLQNLNGVMTQIDTEIIALGGARGGRGGRNRLAAPDISSPPPVPLAGGRLAQVSQPFPVTAALVPQGFPPSCPTQSTHSLWRRPNKSSTLRTRILRVSVPLW